MVNGSQNVKRLLMYLPLCSFLGGLGGLRWTMKNLIANSQLELLCRKDPKMTRPWMECDLKLSGTKVSVHFCL